MTGAKAAIDIGTNSMRLLVVDGHGGEVGRWVEVTGLGVGVDRTGMIGEDAMRRTVEAFQGFRTTMTRHGVTTARAVATSATRDASNRRVFLDRAEAALGLRPETISGEEEAALAYAGAVADAPGPGPFLVVDIGGGSTEFVGEERRTSIDIGSVRLTDRMLPDRPASGEAVEAAATAVAELFAAVPVWAGEVLGVAGTWTSLAAIELGLPAYDRESVHHSTLDLAALRRLVDRLAPLTLDETRGIPALDPRRAPVILAGAVVAREALTHLGADRVIVSEHDLLDGLIAGLP